MDVFIVDVVFCKIIAGDISSSESMRTGGPQHFGPSQDSSPGQVSGSKKHTHNLWMDPELTDSSSFARVSKLLKSKLFTKLQE